MYQLFKPSLHAQRHDFVVDFVRRNKPKKVVDLGCGECGLLGRLRFNHQIALLIGVDLNGAKLRKKMHGLAPLSADYLQPTFDQLCVQLYQGSVTQKDARFRGFDLVTSIELIEHLRLDDLEPFTNVVFGYMVPQTVIISTPNSEFNPLFPGLSGFRHSDHKFEWTRMEFQSWALNVCSEFGYMVEFTGVGQAPPGQEQRIGFCTQIGVFHRLMVDRVGPMFGDNAENNYPYTLVYSVTYPSLCDDNILRRILVSELLFCAEKLKKEWLEKLTDKLEEVNAVEKDETGGECGEIFWSNCQEPQCHNLHRHVSVALQLLCTCCPKLRELSRSLSNLRRLIVDDPQIKMNRERSAVILCCLEQGDEEPNDLTDSGYAERSHVEEENWEITC
ncbi:small RNA 2'-O-methyltransferase isoform X2 [Syngnathoides biaculeatus]|uniref:small RNA 2'-O-methyltransferase isoform X2 n=1 Tax=Syngnathoides biaculeatus TaxID=300417 RepID=UPI002ADD503A|nr:small RNA 2'-O-methyltransferase isoform X2 [Syngnathoides biaculeatus]